MFHTSFLGFSEFLYLGFYESWYSLDSDLQHRNGINTSLDLYIFIRDTSVITVVTVPISTLFQGSKIKLTAATQEALKAPKTLKTLML